MSGEHVKGESLLAILEELADLIATSKSVPMSATVLVNKAEALALLDAARAVVPGQIQDAEEILARAHQVVAEAHEKSAVILREADERAAHLIEKESLVVGAKSRAAEIIANAEERSRTLSDQANDYADRTLAQLQIEVERIASQVSAGRTVISERLKEDTQ